VVAVVAGTVVVMVLLAMVVPVTARVTAVLAQLVLTMEVLFPLIPAVT
jgi:hypothetical protein